MGFWIPQATLKAYHYDGGVDGPLHASTTGAYGLGTGLAWNFHKWASLGLSAQWMRGSSITMATIDDAQVIDHLFTVRVLESAPIYQWLFGLGFGGRL